MPWINNSQILSTRSMETVLSLVKVWHEKSKGFGFSIVFFNYMQSATLTFFFFCITVKAPAAKKPAATTKAESSSSEDSSDSEDEAQTKAPAKVVTDTWACVTSLGFHFPSLVNMSYRNLQQWNLPFSPQWQPGKKTPALAAKNPIQTMNLSRLLQKVSWDISVHSCELLGWLCYSKHWCVVLRGQTSGWDL